MEKRLKYEIPEVQLLKFELVDIIATSEEEWEDDNVHDEGWL